MVLDCDVLPVPLFLRCPVRIHRSGTLSPLSLLLPLTSPLLLVFLPLHIRIPSLPLRIPSFAFLLLFRTLLVFLLSLFLLPFLSIPVLLRILLPLVLVLAVQHCNTHMAVEILEYQSLQCTLHACA